MTRSEETKKDKRPLIRVVRPDTACGDVGHMTVDELQRRSLGEIRDGRCPACGQIHLASDEIEDIVEGRIVDSERYRAIRAEAEG
jgi:hypothetical protein